MTFALTSNPSQSEISEAINYLLANFGANLSVDPNNGQITGSSGIIIAYFYKYLSVKYANSFDGTVNFNNSPTNQGYYGLRNTDSSVESTNPADYIWYQATGGFGTTKFLFYETSGGRQINFVVATTTPGTAYVQESGPAIDLDVVTNSTATAAAAAALATANNKLSKIGADNLQGPISLNTSDSILVGTTTDGVSIGNTGIIGRKAGVTTFSVANTGDAIFAGALSAATGTFAGSLSAATGTFSGSLSAATGTFAGSLSAATGSFTGSISGAANINITGSGIFGGATSSGGFGTFAVVANSGYSANGGIIGYSNIAFNGAIMGRGSGSAWGGYFATTGSQAALACTTSGSGAALQVDGPMVMTNNTLVSNLNADRLDNYHASDFLLVGGALGTPSSGNLTNCSLTTSNLTATAPASNYYLSGSGWNNVDPIMTASGTNSGTATVSGNTLNIYGSTLTGIAGAYVGTSGSGNTVTLTVQTGSPSDPRLKKDIQDSDLGLAFVKGLIPKKYRLIHDPKQQFGYGFLTSDVEKLIPKGSSLVYHEPDLMAGDEKGFDVVHYPSYIAVLTKAIQELTAKVEALEAKG
jgi:hypothetical protein